jgi:von Hippel-Lindau disease tumor suppressor protein
MGEAGVTMRTHVARWLAAAMFVAGASALPSLHAAASGVPAPDPSCAKQNTARPLNDNTPSVITFVNDTSETVQTVWINFSGKHVVYEQIAPGESYMQGTWLTHPWIVADLSGTCLTLYIDAAKQATVVVGTPPVATPPVATLPPVTPQPTTTPLSIGGGTSPGHTSGGATTVPARSTIASALPTPAEAFSSWKTTFLSAAVAILAILLITFPAQLFNRTFNDHYEEIVAFWERRLPFIKRMRAGLLAEHDRARSRAVVALVVVIGALFGGLLDPNFGFNGQSLTTYAAVVLSTLWGIGLTTLALSGYRRFRHHDSHWTLRALPAGLCIAAGCVLVSRLTAFEPGYLYGVVCGAVFTGALAKHEQGHAVAVATLVTVIAALLAWFAWVPVNGAAGQPGASALLIILDDFLGAVFTAGLIGSAIGMIPLRFLPGGTLAAWHRGVWAAVTFVVTFAFVEIMLNPARGGHPGSAAIETAITLFVIFGGGSVWFAYHYSRKPSPVSESAQVDL